MPDGRLLGPSASAMMSGRKGRPSAASGCMGAYHFFDLRAPFCRPMMRNREFVELGWNRGPASADSRNRSNSRLTQHRTADHRIVRSAEANASKTFMICSPSGFLPFSVEPGPMVSCGEKPWFPCWSRALAKHRRRQTKPPAAAAGKRRYPRLRLNS